ncbi:type VII toxin-antitoxin system HepT family RNase toxin [Candidatus Nitrospira inopinata]|jgi:uncharacterized protein YutE (UPF0331/DUF86 family)|uniref:DUF86 domain-containing protein n=1 Tax=Candidatus Nitrospira inopinata TaxID=1715989 RepID=A0A0S4KUQ8_9BACT|nr:DUF86 domain-containing protein [Candidatus Nitrospira inopinata]CUQ67040.1 conserved protein of unknown function [Candidatus Nitrospira inopinata]
MSLNPDLIRARCAEIDLSLSRLEEIGRLSRETFLADRDTLDVACYRLLIAIEAALALCFHVSAKRLHQAPEEYAGCFSALEHAGLIPSDLSGRLQQMARFRNLLVHVYWTIDYGRVYDVLTTRLGDLRAFRAAMAGLIE